MCQEFFSYSIFLSEKRGAVQEECGSNSMSVLSKHVGKMWSQLSPAEKKVQVIDGFMLNQHMYCIHNCRCTMTLLELTTRDTFQS